MSSLVIGVAGGTGSGKTTLTQALIDAFPGKTSVVYHDNYYRAFPDLTYEERKAINWDAPQTFDNDLLVSQLRQLISGQAAVTAAEIALNGIREEAKVGQRTTFDVLTAQQTYQTAALTLIRERP